MAGSRHQSTRFAQRVSRQFTLEEVMPLILRSTSGRRRAELDGISVKVHGERLRTFTKGTSCVACGIEAKYFAVDVSHGGSIHLNLYALDEEGNEVLMTSDHIFPRSRGGSNSLDNRQPMCICCNFEKGTTVPETHAEEKHPC